MGDPSYRYWKDVFLIIDWKDNPLGHPPLKSGDDVFALFQNTDGVFTTVYYNATFKGNKDGEVIVDYKEGSGPITDICMVPTTEIKTKDGMISVPTVIRKICAEHSKVLKAALEKYDSQQKKKQHSKSKTSHRNATKQSRPLKKTQSMNNDGFVDDENVLWRSNDAANHDKQNSDINGNARKKRRLNADINGNENEVDGNMDIDIDGLQGGVDELKDANVVINIDNDNNGKSAEENGQQNKEESKDDNNGNHIEEDIDMTEDNAQKSSSSVAIQIDDEMLFTSFSREQSPENHIRGMTKYRKNRVLNCQPSQSSVASSVGPHRNSNQRQSNQLSLERFKSSFKCEDFAINKTQNQQNQLISLLHDMLSDDESSMDPAQSNLIMDPAQFNQIMEDSVTQTKIEHNDQGIERAEKENNMDDAQLEPEDNDQTMPENDQSQLKTGNKSNLISPEPQNTNDDMENTNDVDLISRINDGKYGEYIENEDIICNPHHENSKIYAATRESEPKKTLECYWVFPKQHEHRKCIMEIETKDYDKVLKDEYLNDTIIDFNLKYIYSSWPSKFKDKIYIFTTFFWKKLIKIKGKNASKDDIKQLYRWTKHIKSFFNKDYIIIPKCVELHWELVIICFPGKVLKRYYEQQQQEDDDIDIEKDHDEGKEEQEQDKQEPCIAILDSLLGTQKSGDFNLIRKWLNLMASNHQYNDQRNNEKNNNEKIFTKQSLHEYCVRVPKQPNCYDCGTFLLRNVKQFGIETGFQDTSKKKALNLSKWYCPTKDGVAYRTEIQETIEKLINEQKGILTKSTSTKSKTPTPSTQSHSQSQSDPWSVFMENIDEEADIQIDDISSSQTPQPLQAINTNTNINTPWSSENNSGNTPKSQNHRKRKRDNSNNNNTNIDRHVPSQPKKKQKLNSIAKIQDYHMINDDEMEMALKASMESKEQDDINIAIRLSMNQEEKKGEDNHNDGRHKYYNEDTAESQREFPKEPAKGIVDNDKEEKEENKDQDQTQSLEQIIARKKKRVSDKMEMDAEEEEIEREIQRVTKAAQTQSKSKSRSLVHPTNDNRAEELRNDDNEEDEDEDVEIENEVEINQNTSKSNNKDNTHAIQQFHHPNARRISFYFVGEWSIGSNKNPVSTSEQNNDFVCEKLDEMKDEIVYHELGPTGDGPRMGVIDEYKIFKVIRKFTEVTTWRTPVQFPFDYDGKSDEEINRWRTIHNPMKDYNEYRWIQQPLVIGFVFESKILGRKIFELMMDAQEYLKLPDNKKSGYWKSWTSKNFAFIRKAENIYNKSEIHLEKAGRKQNEEDLKDLGYNIAKFDNDYTKKHQKKKPSKRLFDDDFF